MKILFAAVFILLFTITSIAEADQCFLDGKPIEISLSNIDRELIIIKNQEGQIISLGVKDKVGVDANQIPVISYRLGSFATGIFSPNGYLTLWGNVSADGKTAEGHIVADPVRRIICK